MKCKVIITTLWFCKVFDFFDRRYNNIEIINKKEIPYSKCVAKMPMNTLSNWSVASVRLKYHGTAR